LLWCARPTAASSHLAGDSAIALVSSAALAIGVVATSLSSGSNVDVMNYLFGSILTMTAADVRLAAVLSLAVLLLFVLLYHRIFAVTFDETFARDTGIRANLYNMVLALLTAVTIVIGMRLMGTPVIDNHADFRLMSRPALDALSQFGEVNLFLRGIVPMVGFKSGIVEYERHERFAGQSKYPLGKMLSFAFDGITSFSTMPIRLITLAGFGIFVVSLLALLIFLVQKLLGYTVAEIPVAF